MEGDHRRQDIPFPQNTGSTTTGPHRARGKGRPQNLRSPTGGWNVVVPGYKSARRTVDPTVLVTGCRPTNLQLGAPTNLGRANSKINKQSKIELKLGHRTGKGRTNPCGGGGKVPSGTDRQNERGFPPRRSRLCLATGSNRFIEKCK